MELQIFYLDNLDFGMLNLPHNAYPRISCFDESRIRSMILQCTRIGPGPPDFSVAQVIPAAQSQSMQLNHMIFKSTNILIDFRSVTLARYVTCAAFGTHPPTPPLCHQRNQLLRLKNQPLRTVLNHILLGLQHMCHTSLHLLNSPPSSKIVTQIGKHINQL